MKFRLLYIQSRLRADPREQNTLNLNRDANPDYCRAPFGLAGFKVFGVKGLGCMVSYPEPYTPSPKSQAPQPKPH